MSSIKVNNYELFKTVRFYNLLSLINCTRVYNVIIIIIIRTIIRLIFQMAKIELALANSIAMNSIYVYGGVLA
jgi:hypothetical protein